MSLNKLMTIDAGLEVGLQIGCEELEVVDTINTNRLFIDGVEITNLNTVQTSAMIGGKIAPFVAYPLTVHGLFERVSSDRTTGFFAPNTTALDQGAPYNKSGIVWTVPSVYVKATGHVEFTASSTGTVQLGFEHGANIFDMNRVIQSRKCETSKINTLSIEGVFLVGSEPTIFETWLALEMALDGVAQPVTVTITNWMLTTEYLGHFILP